MKKLQSVTTLAVGLALVVSAVSPIEASAADLKKLADELVNVTNVDDIDDDGHADTAIREGGRTIEAGTVPEPQQSGGNGDVDGDGYGDTVVNILKGKLPTGVASSTEDNEDVTNQNAVPIALNKGLPHVASVEINASTPALLEALSISTSSLLLQTGITISVTADICGVDDIDDDCDGSEDTSASIGMSVSRVIVRGWDPEKKTALQTQAREITTIETPNDFGIWLAAKILEDKSIIEANISSDEVVLKYETKARLLGVIPMTIPVTATRPGRVKLSDLPLDRGVATEVELDYPWYSFLVPKKSITTKLTSQVLEIDTNYQASMGTKVAKFKAGKALADTVK